MPQVTGDLEDTPFIEEIRNDLAEYTKGRFMVITGPPGESKSMTAARICEKVDDDFNIDSVAIGKTTDFIKLLKQARDGKYHNGNAILGDEMGVIIPARDWNNAQNRVMSLIFQTIRKMGLLVVMTVPAKRMIDIHAQILMKNYGNARYIDREHKRSVFKFYEIYYDDWNDRLMRLLMKDSNGKKVDEWRMALPQRLDLDTYEKRKDELLGHLFTRAEDIFTELEADNGHSHNGTDFILAKKTSTKIAEEMLGNGIDIQTTSDATNLSISHLTRMKRELVKGGYLKKGNGCACVACTV
jgi:hypothetical protein